MSNGNSHSDPTTDHPGCAPTIVGGESSGAAGPFEGPGTRIGPYTILQLIGEGGFGSVFMAMQEIPVQRRVALKVIKLGMDTRQVVARFEQERQALAILDHPNIAKVFDAGATASGRPYFVMELCAGEPIDSYCDRNNLSIASRLELFSQVCHAVQHAHTKGIIHRDLKPTNVLVSTVDNQPLAKVIDFGIAKATVARLTDQTFFTELKQIIGTPEYMSPEQAEGSIDIDTRTDVYALGVMLYQLLTGTTPFSTRELGSADYTQIQRLIRELEPQRPSTRISRSTDTIARIAARRQTHPRKLGTIVKGDLDWIVMKAMDKDRARRYETANGLAMDIRRFLAGEPVTAAPPSAGYRLHKLIRRNRVIVTAGAAVAVALLAGLAAFAWQAQVARRQRDLAVQAEVLAAQQRDRAVNAEKISRDRADELQKVSDFQAGMLSQIDASDAGDKLIADIRERFTKALKAKDTPAPDLAARESLLARELSEVNATDAAAAMIDRVILKPSIKAIDDRFKDQPAVAASLRQVLADLYKTLGLYQAALPLQVDAVETRRKVLGQDDPATLDSRRNLAALFDALARYDEGIEILTDTLERNKRVRGPDATQTIDCMSDLGNMLRTKGDFAHAEPLLHAAMDASRRVRGPTDRNTLVALNTYGQLLMAQGKIADAEPYWREACETGRKVFGEDDPDTLIWTANMGGLMLELGKWDQAADLYRQASDGFRRVRGEEHPYTLSCLESLSLALSRQFKLEEAGKVLSQVLAAQRRTLGSDHPSTLTTMGRIGSNLVRQRRFAEAEAVLRECIDASRRVLGNENNQTLDLTSMLATTLRSEEKFGEADALSRDALAAAERTVGKEHPLYLSLIQQLGTSLLAQGRLDEAEPFLRLAESSRRKVSGPTHPETAYALNTLGVLLRDQGKLAESESALREAVSIMHGIERSNGPAYANTLADLCGVLLSQNKIDEAQPLCDEVETKLAAAPPDPIRAATIHRTRARLQAARHNFQAAEAELLEAYRLAAQAPEGGAASQRETARDLTSLYAAWHAADPANGHDSQSAHWAAKSRLLPPPAPTAPR